jgi:hypothetical protein
MKKSLLIISSMLASLIVNAQTDPNLNSWHLNTTGAKASYWSSGGTKVNMTDSSGVTRLAYSSSSVYIKSKGLADDYTMGYNLNLFTPVAKSYTFKIPKSPSQQTGTKTAVPGGGAVAISVNGVVIYGNRDAESYKSSSNTNVSGGDDLWHGDAWFNEGSTMDTSGKGHSTNAGAYHYHATPIKLYSDPSTSHSPIIGYALDGYPIYGPFGYTSAMDNTSAIKRMTSGYALRSITTRTTLPSGATSNPAGPNVSASFQLGMYTEDYSYTGSGDLDVYNGRTCVTPEYPSGTYAYFITTDNSGNPAFPYIFADYYYGVISASDMGPNIGAATIPSSGVTYVTSTTTGIVSVASPDEIAVYPNPASDKITIEVKKNKYTNISISDMTGRILSTGSMGSDKETISLEGLDKGIYFITLTDTEGNSKVLRIARQ